MISGLIYRFSTPRLTAAFPLDLAQQGPNFYAIVRLSFSCSSWASPPSPAAISSAGTSSEPHPPMSERRRGFSKFGDRGMEERAEVPSRWFGPGGGRRPL
jgi:hypothetical protein